MTTSSSSSSSSFLLMMMLMMLLVLTACDRPVETKKQDAAVSADDHGSRLRALWKLQMKETLLRGKGSAPRPIRELLYCRVGIGYHLQILSNGSVGGVHKPTENCWLKVFSMKQGVVGIRGVRSSLYLCLTADGLAFGAAQFSDDCLLKENLEENHYTTYSSVLHPGVYLALSPKGELRRGGTVGRHQACTHFLPRRTS